MTPTGDESDDEMHRQVEWMRPSDRSIVKEVADYGGWIKPASLYLNLPYGRKHVADRCRILAENGLLERHEETAAYRITDFGQKFLNDELDTEELEE